MLKEVTRAHRPSLMTSTTQLMFGVLDVKGDATDASVSEREIPAFARFNAPQSFAPSPHIPKTKMIHKKTYLFRTKILNMLHKIIDIVIVNRDGNSFLELAYSSNLFKVQNIS